MTVTSVASTTAASSSSKVGKGLSSLDQGDFLKLMTAQIQQQDPFDPVDQKEMLAQMAQFSQLAGTTEMGDTLKAISAKLDTLATAQSATNTTIRQSVDALAAKIASAGPAA